MPDFGNLLLWGVPILGLANAFGLLLAWAIPALGEKYVKLYSGLLFALLAFAVMTLEYWVGMWPPLEQWGPAALWAFTAFLMFMGFYPQVWKANWFKRQWERFFAPF